MIISMKRHSTKEEVEAVCDRIRDFGYKIHAIEGEERVVIGAVGVGDVTPCLESLEAMDQVEKAVAISAPYKFVSREFHKDSSVIKVDGATFGGTEFPIAEVLLQFRSVHGIDRQQPPCHVSRR